MLPDDVVAAAALMRVCGGVNDLIRAFMLRLLSVGDVQYQHRRLFAFVFHDLPVDGPGRRPLGAFGASRQIEDVCAIIQHHGAAVGKDFFYALFAHFVGSLSPLYKL